MRRIVLGPIGKTNRQFLLVLCAGWLAVLPACPVVQAGEKSDKATSRANTVLQVQYALGFNGRFKQGLWTPIHVQITNPGKQQFSGHVVVESSDSDGIPVQFLDDRNEVMVAGGQTVSLTVYVRVGRLPWNVKVGVYNDTLKRLEDQRVYGHESQLSATDFLILQIGDRLPFRPANLQAAFTERPDLVEVAIVTEDTNYQRLPDRWYGYEAVDLLVMTTSGGQLLESLSADQQVAIRQWVHQGGRLLLFAGRRGPELAREGHLLRSLIPGEIKDITTSWNTAGLEKFANAEQRLLLNSEPGNALALIQPTDGLVELRDLQNAQARYPLIVHSARGLGAVTYVAFDPEQEPMASWAATPRVLSRLVIGSHFADQGDEQVGTALLPSHSGFDDLAGQLRATLDQFDGVTPTRFMWVAGLLGLFVLAIGPLDYYLLRKIQRFHWTWITFPTAVVGFSAVVLFMLASLRVSSVALNQVEIVDVDVATQTVRGTNYASVYSPTTAAYSFEMSTGRQSMPLENRVTLACWQGLPGAGLGGLGRSSYQVLIDHQYQVHLARGQITSIPVQHGGTRSLSARWYGDTTLKVDYDFYTDPASGALRGTVANPFDFDLHDALILFDGRVYPVGRIFASGEQVDIIDLSGDSQGIDNFFTRFQSGNQRHTQRVWNVMDESVERIVQQMMFNQEIGGERYTGLLHRYQSYLDTSNLLRLRRAVLIGKARQGMTEFVCDDGFAGDVSAIHRFYRVVIPVAEGADRLKVNP